MLITGDGVIGVEAGGHWSSVLVVSSVRMFQKVAAHSASLVTDRPQHCGFVHIRGIIYGVVQHRQFHTG